jgi:hypothetical protein
MLANTLAPITVLCQCCSAVCGGFYTFYKVSLDDDSRLKALEEFRVVEGEALRTFNITFNEVYAVDFEAADDSRQGSGGHLWEFAAVSADNACSTRAHVPFS